LEDAILQLVTITVCSGTYCEYNYLHSVSTFRGV